MVITPNLRYYDVNEYAMQSKICLVCSAYPPVQTDETDIPDRYLTTQQVSYGIGEVPQSTTVGPDPSYNALVS